MPHHTPLTVHWLEWIPQLLAGLGNREGRVMHMILHSVGKAHPQALYFPIRALYLSLKVSLYLSLKVSLYLSLKVSLYLSLKVSLYLSLKVSLVS